MRATFSLWRVSLSLLVLATIAARPAHAQMGMSGSRSLGGYGAATITQYYSNNMSSYMPYNGNASGFVPYRGGYAGGFGTQPLARRLPETSIGGALMPMTAIGGSSLTGGVGGMGGMGGAPARGALLPFGYEGGIGLGMSAVGTPMTKQGGMAARKPSGPGFGNPFRMPPDLAGASGAMPAMSP